MNKSLLKKALSLALLLTTVQLSFGQQHRTCGTMDHMADMQQQDPKLKARLDEAETIIEKWIQSHPNAGMRTSSAPDTIPVVVHVVYRTAAENISDAQVLTQIDVLNNDFARLNADTVNTPVPFQAVAGGIPYRFILARRDPNGASTTGIVRKSTTTTSFSTNNAVKYTAQGGDDAWNTSQYLNIWVCNLGATLLGYGEFPTGTPTLTRGFVCNYTCTGTIGTAAAPYNGGRTTTHEIGHCFNLYHIWGDDNGACTGTDYVTDTPNQGNMTYGSPAWPITNDPCTAGSPGIMFMNYMDYTDDGAMNMFTNGQVARITAAITNFYPGLINSPGIQPVNLLPNDAQLASILSPSGNSCSTTITPSVRIKNAGGGTLSSCTINYSLDGAAVQQYAWTGTLASLATADVTLPAQTVSAGAHTFSSYTSSPNGTTDSNNANDSANVTFSISGGALPYSQNFEGTFPPAEHVIVNSDGLTTWAQTTQGKHGGSNSMYMDNANYTTGNGMSDDFILPGLDMSTAISPTMTFWHAYKLWTNPTSNPNYSDTLRILVSTDCGVTYTVAFENYGTALTTGTPVYQASDFIPTAAQWRKDTIDLSAYVGNASVTVMFRNVSGYENNLYIDDINIQSATAVIAHDAAASFSAYPNPAKGLVHVEAKGLTKGTRSLIVRNILGAEVMHVSLPQTGDVQTSIDFTTLNAGIYLIELRAGNNRTVQRISIEK
jgi:hypothetical protein